MSEKRRTAKGQAALSSAPARHSMVVPRGGDWASHAAADEEEGTGAELYCPFPLKQNPAISLAQDASLRWALELGLVKQGPALAKLDAAQLGLLEGCVFPEAPLEMLTLATLWTTLFCAIDDFVESSRLGALALSEQLSQTLAAFEGRARGELDSIGLAFADFGQKLRDGAGAPVAQRFGAELERLFSAYVWEEINREHETELDYAGYRIMRVSTIGLRPQFVFSDAIGPAAEPREEATALLAELERITCRVVGWANDIFTYEKELAEGEVHNLVVVLMRTERLTVRTALSRAQSLHDEEVRGFLRAQARLRSLPGNDPAAEYRVAHLRHWMRGHLHWALKNGRYRPRSVAA